MLEPAQKQHPTIRVGHGVTVVAVAAVAAIVAYLAFGWIVGIIAFLIKTVIVVGVIAGALYLVVRHAGRNGK